MYAKGTGNRDWNFSSLFDRPFESSCAVAEDSHIEVRLPSQLVDKVQLLPETGWKSVGSGEGQHILDISKDAQLQLPLDVSLKWLDHSQSFCRAALCLMFSQPFK
jgi:hypothetical protein